MLTADSKVLGRATKRFRSIPYGRLEQVDFSMGMGTSDLSRLSEVSDLGDVDAFLSHRYVCFPFTWISA